MDENGEPHVPEKKKIFTSIALTLIIALGAFLQLYRLGAYSIGNTYYAATVKSMLTSPSNFFFEPFEPDGSVTVDKPPLGFWVQQSCVPTDVPGVEVQEKSAQQNPNQKRCGRMPHLKMRCYTTAEARESSHRFHGISQKRFLKSVLIGGIWGKKLLNHRLNHQIYDSWRV